MLLRPLVFCCTLACAAFAQQPAAESAAAAPARATPVASTGAAATPGGAGAGQGAGQNDGTDRLLKALEIQNWYARLGDIAEISEIRYTSLPPHKPANPTAPGAKNPL